MRFHPTIVALLLLLQISYCATYISEINFIGEEFIEIYSDEILYFNNSYIIDESSNSNSLSSIQNSSSYYYLIVGSSFLGRNNLSTLDCSVYLSDKSQVSNGGLKSAGESFTIYINSTFNLTWDNNDNFEFGLNESLNFNNNSNYKQLNYSICNSNNFILEINSSNLFNESSENSTPVLTCDSNRFSIITESEIFEDKIEYSFNTNLSNYSIKYWIEDFNNNIVKSKRDTNSLAKKSYTPDEKTDIYKIKAQLTTSNNSNCSILKEKTVSFYSNLVEEENADSEDDFELESYIEIKNRDLVEQGVKNELEYSIYRGDTSKRTVYFYLNSQKISSNELTKYSKVKGRLLLNFDQGNNELVIQGLDIEEIISIYLPLINDSRSNDLVDLGIKNNQKQFFEIKTIDIEDTTLNLNLDSNLENLTGSCYVLNKRTKISNEFNLSLNKLNTQLNVNDSNLENNTLLKLTCKYKKSHLKSYNYESKEFNYTIENISLELNIPLPKVINESFIDVNSTSLYNSFNQLTSNNSVEKVISKSNLETPKKVVYSSENEDSKSNSLFFILIGSISLLSLMLLKW
jgi:hypothetical protein